MGDVRILIDLKSLTPPAGELRRLAGDELEAQPIAEQSFWGWLGLLKALSESLGESQGTSPDPERGI